MDTIYLMNTLELFDTGTEADLRASSELLTQFAEHISLCPTSEDAISALESFCREVRKKISSNSSQLYPILYESIGEIALSLPQNREAKLRLQRIKAAKAYLCEITEKNISINKQDILRRESSAIALLKDNGAQIKEILVYLNKHYEVNLKTSGLKPFSRSDLQRILSTQKSIAESVSQNKS